MQQFNANKFNSSKTVKTIWCILLIVLFFISAILLSACENPNKTPANIQEKYEGMIRKFNNENIRLFGDIQLEQGNTVVVTYNDASIQNKITNNLGMDDVSNRYKALNDIQANLLKYIFRYYEVWNQSFYQYADEYNQKEINKLYDSVLLLEKSLARFNDAKLIFESEVAAIGNTSAVATTINKFTYEYNMLIEECFAFVDYFKAMHVKYVAGNDDYSLNSVQRLLAEGYYNIAKYVYYENVLPLNRSTLTYGICDQLELMNNKTNEYVITNTLNLPIKLLGDNITSELTQTEFNDQLTNKFANIIDSCSAFNQAFKVYLSNYQRFDNATFLKIKLQLLNGMSLNDYIESFMPVEKNIYNYFNLFLTKTFVDYKYTFNELLN